MPGIECAGVVDAERATPFRRGRQVVAMTGGMGRTDDGGYAQYTVVSRSQIIPILTGLPWEVVGAFPEMRYIPSGVRLTGYGGDAADLPQPVLQRYLDAQAAGAFSIPLHHVDDGLEEVVQAHRDMEDNRGAGKLVVRVRHD